MTCPVPYDHFSACFTPYVIPQVSVRCKNNLFILWKTSYYFQGVCGSTDNIGHGLYLCSSIHVGYYGMTRIFLFEGSKYSGWTGISQGTTSLQIRNKDLFIGSKNFGSFSHEVNTCKKNNICICFSSLLR